MKKYFSASRPHVNPTGGKLVSMLIPLIMVLALLLGCQQSIEAQEMSLDKSADGSSLEIAAGESFTVTLESNITTGYCWSLLEGDESIVALVEQEYLAPENEQGIGAGSYEVWRFAGAAAGTTLIRMGYLRPWESVAPIETFTLDVTVTDAGPAGSKTAAAISNAQDETEMIELTSRDYGATKHVTAGDQSRLSLPANPTTAYYWSVTEIDPAILEQTGHDYEQTGDPDDDGAGGIESWSFKAAQPGTTLLKLTRTAGDDANDIVDMFEIELVVDPRP